MKQLYVLIISIILLSCSNIKSTKNVVEKDNFIGIKKDIDLFESYLNKNKIKPTFISNLDSITYFNKNLKIKIYDRNNDFKISINEHTFNVKKLESLNDVWSGKDSLSYLNEISQIKYYEELNKLLILLKFDMCTGLGCSVNYQIIYDLNTKNIYPFGRFRTGDDMDIYQIENINYYLSKTFHGRNAELKDTIFYELFKIDNVNLSSNFQRIAEFTYQDEDYEIPKTFKSNLLKK